MAVLKVTLPAGAIPVDGLQVSFKVPCNCNTFSHIAIDGEHYALCDANHRNLAACDNVWSSGALLSVVLDVANKCAYLQNGAVALQHCNFVYTESNQTPALTVASAGCITLVKGAAELGVVRSLRVFDDVFRAGDVLEIYRNCKDPVNINFINSKACGPNVDSSYVRIPNVHGIAKFIFAPDRSYWIASGDVAPL